MGYIICSKPWWCDEHGWRKSSWWLYDDGSFSLDEFSDGDHEDCDADDVPDCDELEKAWSEYALSCLETGEDPLGEFYIKDTYTKYRVWIIDVRNWIGARTKGLKVVGGKSGKKRYLFRDLPKYVKDYLLTDNNGNIDGVHTLEQLDELLPKVGRKYRVDLEEEIPYSENTIKRELRRKVRWYLRTKAGDQI